MLAVDVYFVNPFGVVLIPSLNFINGFEVAEVRSIEEVPGLVSKHKSCIPGDSVVSHLEFQMGFAQDEYPIRVPC